MLAALLNRMLQDTPEIAASLAQFAGHTLSIETPVAKAHLVLTAMGQFAQSAAEPEASIEFPMAFFVLRSQQPMQALAEVKYDGDVQLAGDVATLLAQLHFDRAQWLSDKVGDVLAHRLLKASDTLGAIPASVGARLLQACKEYLSEDVNTLPKSQEVKVWVMDVAEIQIQLAQLEARIQSLESRSQ